MDLLRSLLLFESTLANVATILLVALTTLYWYGTRNYGYWKKRNIAGPYAVPFIGNTILPTQPMVLMHKDFVKRFGKIYGIFQGQKPILVVADPDVIKQVMVKDFHLFRNRPTRTSTSKIMEKNLVAAKNEEWKRIRSILTPMFTNSKLRKMEHLMSQCIDGLEKALAKNADKVATIKVHDLMGNFTMDVIAKCAFATETNAHSETMNPFVRNAKSLLNFSLFRTMLLVSIPQFFTKLMFRLRVPFFYVGDLDFFIDTSRHIIKNRKENELSHMQDMLQLMVKAEHSKNLEMESEDKFDAHHVNVGEEELENEKKLLQDIIGTKYLTEEEIIAQSVVFLLAGYETTASTLTYCIYELAMNPDIQQRLYEEIHEAYEKDSSLSYDTTTKLEFLDSVLSETLRKYPPAPTLTREASEACTLEKYNIKLEKGSSLFIPTYAIHHDDQYYPNPEKWNPDRFMPENRDQLVPYTYLSFGGGPRNCIGMRFALAEAKLGLSRMVHKFEFFKAAQTEPELRPQNGMVLLKTKPIYVGVKRRSEPKRSG